MLHEFYKEKLESMSLEELDTELERLLFILKSTDAHMRTASMLNTKISLLKSEKLCRKNSKHGIIE